MRTVLDAIRQACKLPGRALGLMLAVFGALAIPSFSFAGEKDVVLRFTDSDRMYLYISLAIGIITVIGAFALRSNILKRSPGGEKMQEVGRAIREGALAYLQQQVKLMAVFVVLLGVGLFFLFDNNVLVSLAFIGGVSASYIAGYAGMLTAVDGNMRTANAALTSYKKALETAFHSGAVAGLITVGLGLLGATIILLFGGDKAMVLLVGFGFGGSLAALFMRVGGGIFTKAADVGADLVGKVEAGIPEDDPRNPATIADNVGDNVGDCAGMAADIFESYEVTLVAAIVLGAATAAIFDQATWMRLVLFALMARGVGIVASALGIWRMRGSDDIDSDPLMAIRKGFYVSAAIAGIATWGLAWWMMGGQSNPITTTKLTSVQERQIDQFKAILAARDRFARENKKKSWEVAAKDIANDPSLADVKAPDNPMAGQAMSKENFIDSVISRFSTQATSFGDTPDKFLERITPSKLSGYSLLTAEMAKGLKISFPADIFPVAAGKTAGPNDAINLSDAMASNKLELVLGQITIKQKQGAQANKDQKILVGPVVKAKLEDWIKDAKTRFKDQITIGDTKMTPVLLYADREGHLVAGAETIPDDIDTLNQSPIVPTLNYRQMTAEEVKAAEPKAGSTEAPKLAPLSDVRFAKSEKVTVAWWLFAIAITFGLLMAFAIEWLTDYYVSTHKKPVQEVAGVSSAGPAPMIIQGFAYAAESSVFMVFAIVIALLVPLFLFNPVTYGGLILSFYGIALVGLGLLTTTGYVLAMDTFGPISDNAQGVYEMSGEGHTNIEGGKRVQRLDAAGNTTKALTKGFAIATAVVAAVALFHSYLEDAQLGVLGLRLDVPEIFLGLLIGGAAPFLFSAFSINAVGRASFQLINEVRRQFKADPGIMAGTSKPNYGSCVAIVTAAAQKELLGPGILAIALPIAVAFGFSIGKPQTMIGGEAYNLVGAQALGGFLAGAILSGQLMAVLLANSGGMWDNAKKLIEDGLYGGKGSEAHKAGVVCDTVGDPFKDTAGPALNPLIKVMNLVALLLAPVIIRPFGTSILASITIVALGLLAIAIYISKKGSMSTALQAAVESEAADKAAAALEAKPAKKTIKVSDDEPEKESAE